MEGTQNYVGKQERRKGVYFCSGRRIPTSKGGKDILHVRKHQNFDPNSKKLCFKVCEILFFPILFPFPLFAIFPLKSFFPFPSPLRPPPLSLSFPLLFLPPLMAITWWIIVLVTHTALPFFFFPLLFLSPLRQPWNERRFSLSHPDPIAKKYYSDILRRVQCKCRT